MADNNLKEESPKFNAGYGGKNEAKKVIEKRCHIQGPQSPDISTGKMMESSKWSSGLREFVTRQEAEGEDGQKNETRGRWKGTTVEKVRAVEQREQESLFNPNEQETM